MNKVFHFGVFYKKAVCMLLVLLFLLPALTACGTIDMPSNTGLVISEVVSSNTRSLIDPDVGSPDWIELYNGTGYDLSLAGYGLSDNVREPHKWVFPDVTIKAGEYLIVYADKSKSELGDGIFCTGFGLSKGGETLLLTDQYYNILCEVEIPALVTDISYALHSNGNYGYCANPTPGAENNGAIVSELAELTGSHDSGHLVISEILPDNDNGITAEDGRHYAWVELYNDSDEAVLLQEYWLSDDIHNLSKWRLPEMTLQGNSYLLVYLSGRDEREGELHASFRMGAEDDTICLSNKDGELVSSLTFALPMTADLSAVSTTQGTRYTAYPTPAAENSALLFESNLWNTMDETDPLHINEVLTDNRFSLMDADGDRSDWVELYNSSDSSVSLAGYYISDDADTPAKWAFPDITLDAGAYLIVFLSGKDRTDGELHASFKLSEDDPTLILTNLNGLRQEALPLTPDIPENVSVGPGNDGSPVYYVQPTPGAKNSTKAQETLENLAFVDTTGVFISEVSAASAVKSGQADWIELYNGSDSRIELTGWHLTDSLDELEKFELSAIEIPAKGYSLVYASTRTAKQKGVTAPFGISEDGETLYLYNDDGILVDHFASGALRDGISSGRSTSDSMGTRLFYLEPTPGKANSQNIRSSYAAAPVFSETELYQTEAFSLSMTCTTEGAEIYYTLDGSEPDSSDILYTSPITISKNTPVRAVAIREGLLSSDVTSATYLFETPHTLPVVCLSGAPNDIDAVYAATTKAERVEREGYMEFYEADGRLGVKFPCGLRASGASTLLARQKSFTVFLRTGYGRGEVRYPFWGDYEIKSFSSMVLRNSGQDRERARMRDSYCSLAAEGLNIDNIATRPVIVYINGSYWGIYDLNENQNEDYLAAHYGVDPDAVDIVRRNVSAIAGSNRDFKRVREIGLNRNLADDELFAQYSEWVDVEYVTDYLIVQTFFSNSDMFNQKYWRSQDYTVKWRPVLFDMDFGARRTTGSNLSAYFTPEGIPSKDGSLTNMDIYVGLQKNAAWREKFAERYVYVVVNHLNRERLLKIFDEYYAALKPEMERHIKRWGAPSSMSVWEKEVASMRSILEQRPDNILKSVQSYFGISDAKMQEYKQQALLPENSI